MARTPRQRSTVEAAIRPARASDLAPVIALDSETTGLAKPEYWHEMFQRCARNGFFLVAADEARLLGFVAGEVRAWEFGSPPCGWVFAVQVRPGSRQAGLGSRLFAALCEAFRAAGVDRVRTMLAREDTVIHAFFRSQGMTAGPFIQLESRLD